MKTRILTVVNGDSSLVEYVAHVSVQTYEADVQKALKYFNIRINKLDFNELISELRRMRVFWLNEQFGFQLLEVD